MPHNFIIAYPEDGSRKRDLTKGIITIDFWEGKVHLPNGTTTDLKTNLKNSDQQFIRSLVIFSTQGMKVRLGAESNAVRTFSDQCNWNVYENISIREVEIETSFTATPDEVDFMILGSTSNKAIYKPIPIKLHQHIRRDGVASTDAYATLLELHTIQYKDNTFVINETGGANGITYKIEAKLHSSGNYVEVQGDTTVAAGANDVVQISGVFHFLKVSIKATIGASQGTVEGQWNGLG